MGQAICQLVQKLMGVFFPQVRPWKYVHVSIARISGDLAGEFVVSSSTTIKELRHRFAVHCRQAFPRYWAQFIFSGRILLDDSSLGELGTPRLMLQLVITKHCHCPYGFTFVTDANKLSSEFDCSLVLVGAACAGKSHLAHSFVGKCFNFCDTDVMGIDVHKQNMLVNGTRHCQLTILDLPASPKFSLVRKPYYKADAALVIFDVADRASFERVGSFLDEIIGASPLGCCIKGIVGNKIDSQKREVSQCEALALLEQYGMAHTYWETTVTEAASVQQLFFDVVSAVLDVKGFRTPHCDALSTCKLL
jgi:GTPase SAR1 family protein